jgi:predicted P-loop ATPase
VQDKIDTAALLSKVDIVSVIDRFVPLKKSGAEYEACCPFHTEDTPSFKVSPTKQFYQCFGCGENGDAIAFVQKYQGLSFVDACKSLGGEEVAEGVAPVRREIPREKKESPWTPILPAPADAPEPPKAHSVRGLPERVWCYRDAAGAVLGYVYRFKTSNGGKETLPLSWCAHAGKEPPKWHWMSFPEPRPLYGLDRLAAKPDATVLVVEGEKCADAGHEQLPDLAVVSWPGGGKAVKKADFAPLAGRKVILWADADAKRVPLTPAEKAELPHGEGWVMAAQAAKPLLDEAAQPGVKTMAQVAAILLELGCSVWSVKIPAPGVKADGWDIADAVDEGLTGAALADFIRGNSLRLAQAGSAGEDPSTDSSGGISPPRQAAASMGGGDDGSWRGQLLENKYGLIDCRENIYLLLRNHPVWRGVLWADDFARKIIKRAAPPWEPRASFKPDAEWGEDDDLRLGMWMAQSEGLRIRSTENLAVSVGWAARESRCHPVREYLDALAWDGVPRLHDWLSDFLGVKKSEYTMLAGRLFLIGMVARIYQPGCPMRAMPILEGMQFRGKSTALRILGGKWFGDTPIDLNNKDAYQLIQGRWLYEIAELDAFNRSESTRIKAFISSQEDRFRAPYDRAPKEWPRHTVFVGTTNQDEYFKDQTGNTRYWPWKVEEGDHINLDGLAEVRDQLFAEAVALYQRGERWHPTRDEQQRLFEPEQADREIADPWQSLISKWLRGSMEDRVSVNAILTDCLKIEPGKLDSARQMSTRVGIAMKRIGWIKRRETGGDREYYYLRPDAWRVGETDIQGGDRAPF